MSTSPTVTGWPWRPYPSTRWGHERQPDGYGLALAALPEHVIGPPGPARGFAPRSGHCEHGRVRVRRRGMRGSGAQGVPEMGLDVETACPEGSPAPPGRQ
ncbi:hypothetical protein GCM10010168_28720 [Actinoplanes ianthinogenes]|uniref:Uncharacterized protein n=1 Tax=Actinoplanes ianthinogenes TaxID=122358 RepID=A0ABM7LLB1_9ACTN|nr:hypothetical protein Aiant_06710 [Actinoplanes ianthinogenes]GGR09680.1 hypothetical protein GCM10010168_28720 [Actinoplanes ianthinogenes]